MQRQYHWRAASLPERVVLVCISVSFNSTREPADKSGPADVLMMPGSRFREEVGSLRGATGNRVRAANTTGGATQRTPAHSPRDIL
jgi:hypothetical protein